MGAARPDAHEAGFGIDAHTFHRREVNDHATVATAQSRPVMAAATDGEQMSVIARECHDGDDVRHVGATRDHQRSLVDHAILKFACLRVCLPKHERKRALGG